MPYRRKVGVPVNTPRQFSKTQGRQQHFAVMFCELGKNCVGAIAGMIREIGIDEVSQDCATPLIQRAQRNIDRLPFFDARGLWHAAQGGDHILQTIASRKNCDDVTQSRNLKIDVGIHIGKLGRNANSLAIAGFLVSPMGMLIHVYTALAIKPRDGGIDVELTAPFRSAEFLRETVAAR
jgi:hypothetical protein